MEVDLNRKHQAIPQFRYASLRQVNLVVMTTIMKKFKHKLTLDRPAIYQIKVPGHLEKNWSDWAGEMTITVGSDNDGLPISTLIGTFDQAALHGLLRRLYSRGSPLISVICVDYS